MAGFVFGWAWKGKVLNSVITACDCDRFGGIGAKAVKKTIVIMTGLEWDGAKLSRKSRYYDRFGL